jgi:ribosomal protein L27
VNTNILEYLNHFKQNRLIEIQCADPEKLGRKRSDSEKARIGQAIQKQREEQKLKHEHDVHGIKSL